MYFNNLYNIYVSRFATLLGIVRPSHVENTVVNQIMGGSNTTTINSQRNILQVC